MYDRPALATILALVSTILATCIVPAPALAWVSVGDPNFHGRRITWYGVAPSLRSDIRLAAAAINATGVRVPLVEVRSRARANIVILRPGPDAVYGSKPCTGTDSNQVRNGVRTPSKITWRPCVAESDQPVFVRRNHAATQRLLAHEMMHAYGLGHEQRRCATMNTPSIGIGSQVVPFRCASVVDAAAAGTEYCRIVQTDDQVGLIALYGGRRRPLPPQLCAFQGIAPPPQFSVTAVNVMPPEMTPDWHLQVTWSGLGADVSGLRILATGQACTAPGAELAPETPSQGPYDVPSTGPTGSFDVQTIPTYMSIGAPGTPGTQPPSTWCVTATPYVHDDQPPIDPSGDATGIPVTRVVQVSGS